MSLSTPDQSHPLEVILHTSWGKAHLYSDDGQNWRHPYPLGSKMRPFLSGFSETNEEVLDFIAQVTVDMLHAKDIAVDLEPPGRPPYPYPTTTELSLRGTPGSFSSPLAVIPWAVAHAGLKLDLQGAWEKSPSVSNEPWYQHDQMKQKPFPLIQAIAQVRTSVLITERHLLSGHTPSGKPSSSGATTIPDPDDLMRQAFLFLDAPPYMGADGLSLHRFVCLPVEAGGPSLFEIDPHQQIETTPTALMMGRNYSGHLSNQHAGWIAAYLLTLSKTTTSLRNAALTYLDNMRLLPQFIEHLSERLLREMTLRHLSPQAQLASDALNMMLYTDFSESCTLKETILAKMEATPELKGLLVPSARKVFLLRRIRDRFGPSRRPVLRF